MFEGIDPEIARVGLLDVQTSLTKAAEGPGPFYSIEFPCAIATFNQKKPFPINRGSTFVDLGCGSKNPIAPYHAKKMGADVYIGVDFACIPRKEIIDDLPCFFWNDDILSYLKKLPCDEYIFLLSGIEPIDSSRKTRAYCKKICSLLEELCLPESIVIQGHSTFDLNLKGFKVFDYEYDVKVYVR